MYRNSVDQFMEALASKSAIPGGGGAAALGGSMAAALGSMVMNMARTNGLPCRRLPRAIMVESTSFCSATALTQRILPAANI